jgi:hypothetical protein
LLDKTFRPNKPVHFHPVAVHLGHNPEVTRGDRVGIVSFLTTSLTKLPVKDIQRIAGHPPHLNVAKFVIVGEEALHLDECFAPIAINGLP